MFDVGFWELILVGLVALMAFGPNELPRLVRDTVRMVRKLRAAANAAGHELRRELQLDDLDHVSRTGSPLYQIRDAADEIRTIANKTGKHQPHTPSQDDEQA